MNRLVQPLANPFQREPYEFQTALEPNPIATKIHQHL